MGPSDVLKRYFGYDAFRPRQREVIDAIVKGEDVMAIMPTGAGKSICFQIPALLFPHGTIIISPLISLMKDQVETLTEQGIPASFVNSTIPYEESIERLRNLYRGKIKLRSRPIVWWNRKSWSLPISPSAWPRCRCP